MEYHAELVKVDTLMEYREKSVMVDITSCSGLMSTMRSLWEYLRTRDDAGESKHPWICGESVFSE